MAQFLRPDGNVTQTGFTGGAAEIDEATASNTDFAWGANGGGNTLEVSLSNPSGTPGSGTTTVRYRLAKTNNGALNGSGNAVTGTVGLYQGTTLIAADTARTLTSTWTAYSFTPNVSGVTDWTDLRLRFTDSTNGGNASNRRGGAISWAELEAPDAPAGITGTMAASESGADGFSGSGTVSDPAVTGTFDATESGTDAASASGSVAVSGSLSASESGSDTASASGLVAIAGTLAAAESGDDTAASSGIVAVSGELTASETGADGFSGAGSVEAGEITGALSASEAGSDSFSGSASVPISGDFSAPESGGDVATFSGMALLYGLLDAAETGSDAASGSGSAEVAGSLDAVDGGQDIFSGSGEPQGDISGSLDATEAGYDLASLFGLVEVSGELAAQDAGEDDLNTVTMTCPRKTAGRPSYRVALKRPRNISRGTR